MCPWNIHCSRRKASCDRDRMPDDIRRESIILKIALEA